MRGAALGTALLLAACTGPAAVPPVDDPAPLPATTPLPAEKAAVADEPLPEVVEAVSDTLTGPLVAAQEALADPAPVLPPPTTPCRRSAASLIVRWEVSSPAYYQQRLERPLWPGGASGVTWGVGYDGGHQPASIIAEDWRVHVAVARLAETAGITGNDAKAALPRFRDIRTPFDYATQVFEERSLIEYERRARRAFEGFDLLRPNACAALVSLVYNRGAAMTGDSRREMRAIRDDCVPVQDYSCIAAQLRAMKRIWRGTVNENGLVARREAEAILAETP